MSFNPCWYWIPIASQPNSSAIRIAAIYILHCPRICRSVSSVSSLVPVTKVSPRLIQPAANRLRFGVGNRGHGGHQGRLAEPFLVNARGIEQIVLDDGVIHPHAAFIEDAENCFARLQIAGQRRAQLPLRSRAEQTGRGRAHGSNHVRSHVP